MIHTNRIVTVREQESIIDRPIVLYRGDREVEIEFTLVGNKFMFSNEGNVIKTTNASHGQLVLNTPSGENMFSELAECHDGKVVFIVTKEMIDELVETGIYSFQIRLYDSMEMKSRVTIPPVIKGFDIRNPIAAEDETNVVDVGLVDYSRIVKEQSNEEIPTFDWLGNYNKTEWTHHDLITENKLNKIEDAIYTINDGLNTSDNKFLQKAYKMEQEFQNKVNTLNTKDKQLGDKIDEVNRTITNRLDKLEVDVNVGDVAWKEETTEYIKKSLDYVTVETFGAKGDGVTDDTDSFIQAIASNNPIKLKRGKTYKISNTLHLNNDLIGEDNTLMFYGSLNKMVSQNKELSIRGVTLDGTNVTNCQYGLFVDTDFNNPNTCYYDMTIKNISNDDNTIASIGAMFYKSSSAIFLKNNLDIKINVDNLSSTMNSIIGDTGGATKGIYISFLKVNCELKCKIHDSLISNLKTEEDSDGISIYLYDVTNKYNKSNISIENCIVTDSRKRSFKIQAPNVYVTNCKSFGRTLTGFDVYGDNCIIDSCINNAYGVGFWFHADGSTLKDCVVLSNDNYQALILSDDANNTTITNFRVNKNADLLEDDIIIKLKNINNCYMDNIIIRNENGLGIGVLLENECVDNTFNNVVVNNTHIGFKFNYSSGSAVLLNNSINTNKYGIVRVGETEQYVKINNSKINSNEIGVYCNGTGVKAICAVNDSEINANKNGLLVGESSEIYNTTIKSNNSSEGFAISGKNIVVKNCRTIGFKYGLAYTYSTVSEITNNSIINSSLGILKTGVIEYIEYNNIIK